MRRGVIFAWMACLIGCLVVAGLQPVRAQTITADLYGQVLNGKGQGVAGARVRVVNMENGLAKEVTTSANGSYSFLNLSPGTYQFTVLARGYATLVNSQLKLSIGQRAEYDPALQATTQARTQSVTTQPLPVETRRSDNSVLISGRQINDLPINRRDFIKFSLLSSAVKLDDTPLTGPYPTTGLDINSQRARGNEVTIDGADAIDESTGGLRAVASQDGVREFRVLQNNYEAEYGRATSGNINIVTKSGTNHLHGTVFGYIRNSRFQARNPFSVQVDPTTGQTTGVKQPYTRLQGGATLGGDLSENKFFYFISLEALHSEKTGFSSIGAGNFGLTSATIPCISDPLTLTAPQATYFKNAITAAGGCLSPAAATPIKEAQLYGAASDTALNGTSESNAIVNNITGVPTTFPLPIDCNYLLTGSCGPSNVVPLPASYVGLASLIGNYPTTEKTYIGSARLDRIWNQNQRSFLYVAITPSNQTGLLVNTPLQNAGLDAGTRASTQRFTDQTAVGQHTIAISNTLINVTRFQYARRGLHFGYSPLTGGNNVAVNIPGAAFFGREPYSTIDRGEKRYQAVDNVTWVHGLHSFKFGVDASLLQLRSTPSEMFDLNYGGTFNFGTLDAGFLQAGLPAFTPVQAYGLGMPQGFSQGIGTSYQSFDNKMLGGFAQDSWRVRRGLTVNYGVRYDLGLAPIFPAGTTMSQDAENALKVVEGLPRDYKDVSPRLGLAWDPTGSGKTVVRAGFGVFYGVAPLALIYDSTAANGTASTQVQVGGGLPTGALVTQDSATQTMNASTIFQGVLGGIPNVTSTGFTACGFNAPISLGYKCAEQRFNPATTNSLFTNQYYIQAGFPLTQLPMTLPVARNFVNGYSEQGSLAVEHEFKHNYTVSVSYTWIHGVHLNRARNINQSNAVLLTQNYATAIKAGLQPSGPLGVLAPSGSPGACISTSGTSSVQVISTGMLGAAYPTSNCTGSSFGYVATPGVFNDFRPSGPNPSFAGQNAVNYDQLVSLAKQAGYPTGYGVPVPWGNVNQQESSGSSLYNGLTVSVSKRLSNHFQFLSSWTWSHALDNSTDLTALLEPQNNTNPNLEWGNSTFDQRHRWVTSAVFESPYDSSAKGFFKKLLANAYVAPIVEVASGRPYTVLTGTDYNLNFNANTDRPSVAGPGASGSASSPYISGVSFVEPTTCAAGIPKSAESPFGQTVPIQPYGCTGNLGRNTFVTPAYFDFDLRLDKKFYFTDTANFEFIAEGFNLLNRFNALAVNMVCNPAAGGACTAGQPSSSFNARQFQFALKLNF
jgi:hypothetical protein